VALLRIRETLKHLVDIAIGFLVPESLEYVADWAGFVIQEADKTCGDTWVATDSEYPGGEPQASGTGIGPAQQGRRDVPGQAGQVSLEKARSLFPALVPVDERGQPGGQPRGDFRGRMPWSGSSEATRAACSKAWSNGSAAWSSR
jgi:hypothetical protein